MKTSKTLLIIILIISVMATACRSTSKNIESEEMDISKEGATKLGEVGANEVEEVEPIKATEGEPIIKSREKIEDSFLGNLSSPYVTAQAIGIYIRENIGYVSEDEADKMFQWLLIYQNQTKEDFMYVIEGEKYLKAFYNDMEGDFEKSKLDNIQDNFIKEDYTELIDSFLILEDQRDYLHIAINWNDLIEYSSYLSDDFRKIIEINKKVNYYEYDRYEFDVEGLSKDIMIIEEILKNKNSTFIQMEGNELYRSLLGKLLVGSQGRYINHYEEKNSKEYKSLMELKSKYPESRLEKIIQDIDLIEVGNIMDIVDIIDKNLQFGLKSDNHMGKKIVENDNGEYEIIEVSMPSDIEKQNRINNLIRLDTEIFIESLVEDKSFNFEMESYLQNNRYIFYSGSIVLTDSSDDYEYIVMYRTLDYLEERYVTLEDYLDVDFNFIRDFVEELTGVKIESLPEFSILDTGIDLHLNESTDIGESIFIKNIDLFEYFTLEEIMGNR